MLVDAFQEVAAMAKREENQARIARDLHDQIREKLDWARVMHNEKAIGLQTVAEGAYQQLEEAMAELERFRVEYQVFKAWDDDLQGKIET